MDVRFCRLLIGVSIVLAAACGGSTPVNPVSSTPLPPAPAPPPGPRATISGTVWIHEANGLRPDVNRWMFGWVQQAIVGSTTGQIPTDGNGRFTFTVPLGAQVRLQGSHTDTYQPCQVVVRADGDVTRDIHLVADRQQLGAQIPAELLSNMPFVSGVVYEQTGDSGRMPLADVRVELDGLGGLGWVAATTLTDASGRYILCGLADEPSTYLYASKSGYKLFESGVRVVGNTTIDIEMRR
jgi:hypothetical protein